MPSKRPLFRDTSGHFDLSRLLEHAIPVVAMGVLTIWGNSLISSTQIANLKEQVDRTETARAALQGSLQATNLEMAKLSAQVVAFLGQQVTLNAAMDARLTYLERQQRGGSR